MIGAVGPDAVEEILPRCDRHQFRRAGKQHGDRRVAGPGLAHAKPAAGLTDHEIVQLAERRPRKPPVFHSPLFPHAWSRGGLSKNASCELVVIDMIPWQADPGPSGPHHFLPGRWLATLKSWYSIG